VNNYTFSNGGSLGSLFKTVGMRYRRRISARGFKKGRKTQKGDPRMLVPCPAVETLVFSDRHDPEKAAGRKRDRAKRGLPDAEERTSVDMADEPIANVLVGVTGW
jgi:hypothetical protein